MTEVSKEEAGGWYRLDPIPTDSELTSFYESRYYHLIRAGGRAPELRRMIEGGAAKQGELAWLRDTLYADIAAALQTHAPQARRILDVGAGTGDFVAYMRERGYEAQGIEPAREPSEAARAAGLPIHTSTLAAWADDAAHSASVDVVVMLNVLEHVPAPAQTLTQCRQLLRAGGLAVIRVPNDFTQIQQAAQDAIQAREPWWVAAPDHINYFNFASLEAFLRHCGMETLSATTDFPMELFLLMGEDYVSDPALGGALHRKRVQLETALPAPLRRKLYGAFAAAGIGRNVLSFSRKVG